MLPHLVARATHRRTIPTSSPFATLSQLTTHNNGIPGLNFSINTENDGLIPRESKALIEVG